MSQTLEERERRAYIEGRVADAQLLNQLARSKYVETWGIVLSELPSAYLPPILILPQPPRGLREKE